MNVVMFGQLTWDHTWYSRHHLTVGLAKRHGVVQVDPPQDFGSVLARPARLVRGARLARHPVGVLAYQPPGWLPQVYASRRLGRMFDRWRGRALVRTLQRAGVAPDVCYVWHPDFHDAVAPLDELPLVYHAYDKYDLYTNAPVEQIRAAEASLARRAALCVAASSKLGEYLRDLGARHVLVLRHGVDAARFRPGLPEPAALRGIPRPRIGVVARLNEALDVPALTAVAGARPQWSLVLVGAAHFSDGSKQERFEAFCRLPNVHHVGPQPQDDIPRWLDGLDVGLACYDLRMWGPYNQPIKIYEYLGCGLPVVSSDIGAAREFGDLLVRSVDAHGWVPAIERALAQRSPADLERRIAYARANSWERRVDELEAALAGVTRDGRTRGPAGAVASER